MGLRVYWFSQTFGPGRGLEDAIVALGRTPVRAQLSLRGRPQAGYLDALPRWRLSTRRSSTSCTSRPHRRTRWSTAPVVRHRPCARADDDAQPSALSDEQGFHVYSRRHASRDHRTPGRHALAADLGRAAAVVEPGNIDALASTFARRADDAAELDCAKRTAWSAASRRWHWEHDAERGGYLPSFARRSDESPPGDRPVIKVPPDHYGGIERVVADLADRLASLGHDVTLWAAPGSQMQRQRRTVRPRRGVDQVEQRPERSDARRPFHRRRATLRHRSTTSDGSRI